MDLNRHIRSLALLFFILSTYFSSVLTRHSGRRHKRQHAGANMFLPDKYVIPGGEGPPGTPWGQWGAPSPCSRTCGGGVSYQTRECRDREADGTPRCEGGAKKYFSCNTNACPEGSKDFRSEQCSAFDNTPFDGTKYEWVPYTKAPNPCELNCMPRHDRFYYRHKMKVVDGTRCNAETKDVCVDGKCQPVGCDDRLGSTSKEDKCRNCEGDGSTCDTQSGLLDMQDLSVGYNDILLIPAGAMNVEVKEIANSNNYLAIRNLTGHYYLNGNWRIDFPRTLKFAGTHWHYDRVPQGFAAPDAIRCVGPTTEPLYLVLLYQDRNVGVQYEYSVDVKTPRKAEPDTYSWTFKEFGPCSASCGGGEQTRNVSCASRQELEIVDDGLCDVTQKPESRQRCGTEPCAPRWAEGPWAKCSTVCGDAGVQTRQIHCERIVSNGLASIVDDEQCSSLGEKPPTTQACNQGVICPEWHIGPWKPCNKLCGPGKEQRDVTCFRRVDGKVEVLKDEECPQPKPDIDQPCLKRPCEGVDWITSKWSGCDACGQTKETRVAHCGTQKGQVYPDNLCANHPKPEVQRECQPVACDSQWFAAQWSTCSAKCGNGIQSRKVFCGTFNDDGGVKKLEDSNCVLENKYEDVKNCTGPEATCDGEWFTGPWSKCSKPCGGGSKTRKVLCMSNEDVVPVDQCDASIIEFAIDNCNNNPCGDDEIMPVDVTKAVTEEPVTKSEDDEVEAGSEDVIDEDAEGEEDWCDEDEESEDLTSDVTGVSDAFEIGGDVTTESSLLTDGLMLSDSTGSETDSTKTDTEITTGSSLVTDGSGEGSGDITTNLDYTQTSLSSSEPDGSGDDEVTGTTVDTSAVTAIETSDSSSISSSDSTETSTDSSTPASSSDSSTDVTSESSSSDSSTDSSTDSSDGTTDSSADTTVSSDSTTDSSDSTTDSSVSTTDSSISTTDSSDSSTDSSVSTSDSSASSTDTTSEATSDSSSMTTEETTEPPSTTDSSSTEFSTTDSSSSVDSSPTSDSSETTTDLPSTTDSSVSTTDDDTPPPSVPGEIDTQVDKETGETDITTEGSSSPSTSESTESASTTEETSTSEDIGSTTEVSTEETTVSGTTDGSETTESSTSLSSDVSTTESDLSTTDSSISTTESDLSTTESDLSTTESSTVTELSSSTVESETGSTETSETTESSTIDEFSSTGTSIDIWSTTDEDDEWGSSTPNTLEAAITKQPKKSRKCKPRPKIPKCLKSTYGCCSDNFTAAQGPFDKGCPAPETCEDTKHGCCSDGVSPAKGPDDKGCPPSQCKESLFGCCPDNTTPAEGNEGEGCPEPTTALPTCIDSEFGCCKDNEQFATGPDKEGCPCEGPECEEVTTVEASTATEPPAVSEDCSSTQHGCCPDNTTATGPALEGCDLPCSKGPFGCCGDRQTPSHGPNGEGCCLTAPFGCCPDNIVPARGENLEGCGCQYSRFGCCPDNATAARGSGNEGCGCQYTEHGCCPNRYTPAGGPGYEGCPCYTFQFGCCPDGVTVAKGPHRQGCGCDKSEHGCCSDGHTPARGPNFDGCDCASSKYGCCPDGQTEAQGEDWDGCPDIPVAPQEHCVHEKDRGTCRNYTVKWFYDMEYGGCSRFWYGGCEGNNNRFKSQDECKAVCVEPQGKDRCLLSKVTGPCEGYYPTWYYDGERKQCGQFIYGGCLGNNNRFETREECQGLCVADTTVDTCEQPVEQGPCNGSFHRWYYDKQTKKCQLFGYGGCRGNRNNFHTEQACNQQCAAPGHTKELCQLPREQGTCEGKESRWFFDQGENRCMPFYYTGCGGNANSFTSRDECERECPSKIVLDTCMLATAVGECHNYTARWYFDTIAAQCRQFYYGGCGGNDNNFQTEEACQKRCEQRATEPESPVQEPFRTEFCLLPWDTGSCSGAEIRWWYDRADGVCKRERYSGCNGNQNNFPGQQECEKSCGNSQNQCGLPVVVGPCDGALEQWYYNYTTDACYPFIYGGCQGNANRYNDQQMCERQCRRGPDPNAIQPVTAAPETGTGDICTAPVNPGPCDASMVAWFHDPNTRRCSKFIYGGCLGNANRFESEELCERQCGRYRGLEVCRYPHDAGSCNTSLPTIAQKVYFDKATLTCQPFNYTGCEVSPNRFSTLRECQEICGVRDATSPPDVSIDNEIDVDAPISKADDCAEANEECRQLRCPYGISKYIQRDCEHCLCYNPCSDVTCTEQEQCGIDLERDPQTGEALFSGVCRLVNKPGDCPSFGAPTNSSRCSPECHTDADCRDTAKCCDNGCSTICVPPVTAEAEVFTEAPQFAYTTESFYQPGVEAPSIDVPVRVVQAEEGNVAQLRCIARGNPPPTIRWWRGDVEIDGQTGSYRIPSPGELQIISLYPSDAGVYTCTADNGVGAPAQEQIQLDVTSGSPHITEIIGDEDANVIAELGSPITLRCQAFGWPRPTITWWHDDKTMVPLSSNIFELQKDNSLLIHTLMLHRLGLYTCQAYNGLGKPASFSVTVKAIGPVYSDNPDHEKYMRFLISAPGKPTLDVSRPRNPFKQEPYIPILPQPGPPIVVPVVVVAEQEVPIPAPTEPDYNPQPELVPVSVNVSHLFGPISASSNVSLFCQVTGSPAPRVSWYKDDAAIERSERVKLLENNQLVIIGAEVSDSGNYRCVAQNEFSYGEASTSVIVEGIFVHANCTDNPFLARCSLIVTAQYCTHSHYARFCCRSCTLAGQLPSYGPHLLPSPQKHSRN